MAPRAPTTRRGLAAQAECTAAAIIAALLLRRVERLDCAAAPLGAVDGLLCRGKAFFAFETVSLNAGLLALAALAAVALIACLVLRLVRKAPVYIVDFSVYKPDARWAALL